MCAECGRTVGHSPRCPNYDASAHSRICCAYCNEVIETGEAYYRIRYAEKNLHKECVDDMTFFEIVELCGDVCTVRIAEKDAENDD